MATEVKVDGPVEKPSHIGDYLRSGLVDVLALTLVYAIPRIWKKRPGAEHQEHLTAVRDLMKEGKHAEAFKLSIKTHPGGIGMGDEMSVLSDISHLAATGKFHRHPVMNQRLALRLMAFFRTLIDREHRRLREGYVDETNLSRRYDVLLTVARMPNHKAMRVYIEGSGMFRPSFIDKFAPSLRPFVAKMDAKAAEWQAQADRRQTEARNRRNLNRTPRSGFSLGLRKKRWFDFI